MCPRGLYASGDVREWWYESATYLVGVYGGGIFAGAERGSRVSQFVLNSLCDRVRDPFRVLERRHGLVEIVERGAGVIASVSRPTRSPEASTLAAVWICRGR